jgi:hypothetical protein
MNLIISHILDVRTEIWGPDFEAKDDELMEEVVA